MEDRKGSWARHMVMWWWCMHTKDFILPLHDRFEPSFLLCSMQPCVDLTLKRKRGARVKVSQPSCTGGGKEDKSSFFARRKQDTFYSSFSSLPISKSPEREDREEKKQKTLLSHSVSFTVKRAQSKESCGDWERYSWWFRSLPSQAQNAIYRHKFHEMICW